MIEVGIGMPAISIDDVQKSAEMITRYPFDSFSIYGDLGDLSPFVALQSALPELRDSAVSSVGVMGFPAGLAHPEVVASSERALYEQLGERLYTGIVRGAFLESIGEKPATLDRVKQTVQYLKDNVADKHRIYIGGYGHKILKLASELEVSGVKIGGSVNPTVGERVRQTLAGTDIQIVMGAVCVVDDDRAVARKLARFEVSKYLAVVGHLGTNLSEDELDSLDRFNNLFSQHDITAPSLISDSLLDKFALSGTPGDVVGGIRALDGIVDRVELGTPHGVGTRSSSLQYIGETILSEIKQ